jgi:glutathione S-transferase
LCFIGTEIHKTFGPLWHPAPAETKAAARARLEHWFGWLDPQLAQGTYLMGEQFTVADAYLYTVVNWTHFLKMPLDRWPHLAAYMDRVAARPGVQAARAAEGLA